MNQTKIESGQQIEIPLSKKKMIFSLLGSTTFVLLGLWFIFNPPKINIPILGNPILILIVGIISVLFFGFITVTIARKFSDNKAGLIINNQGVYDNASGVSAGLVPWEDVVDIKITEVMNQKFLMLMVKNPQKYLNRVKNPIKKSAMRMNYKNYGSPISISSNALKTDFDNLLEILINKWKEF